MRKIKAFRAYYTQWTETAEIQHHLFFRDVFRRHKSRSDECPANQSVGRLHTLDLDRIAVNRAGYGDFLADVPFDLRSIVDFQHLVIQDEDRSRATSRARCSM